MKYNYTTNSAVWTIQLIFIFIYTVFFFNDTATTEIYTLSLHDALRSRLHPCGAAAGDGASLLRLVGLPGDRLLRAHVALRHTRRLPRPRRPPPPARHRRDPRLGSRPLPARRLGARDIRRDAPLRAR